jgi:hypothetical protein
MKSFVLPVETMKTPGIHSSRYRRWLYGCIGLCMGFIGFAIIPGTASAVMYNLDYVFSPPTGTVLPLGSVTLTDLGASVRFELTNQAGAESKLDSLYFNFARAGVNPNQLTFSNISAAVNTYQTVLAPTSSSTVNSLKADGDGYYDGKFEYTGNKFLGHSQSLSFDLAVAGHDLDVSDFHFFSLPGGGTGTYIMASHIRNVSGGDSLWVGTTSTSVNPVPLPAAMWLFGAGLVSIGPMIRRRLLN